MMSSVRSGFALPMVLWLIATMTVTATVAAITAREAVGAALNRVSLARAHWLAEGCAEEIRGQLEEWLSAGADPALRWAALDSSTAQTFSESCNWHLRPAGLVLDVNRADETQLARFARSAGLEQARAESFAAAIADWRDADDVTRTLGAERQFYDQAMRVAPRNAPFGSPEEVLLVRGAETLPGIDSLLGTDGDPVLLTRASTVVMSGLPGMTDEALIAVVNARSEIPFPELGAIADRLSEAAKEEFVNSLPTLYQLTTAQPTSWILTVTARVPAELLEAHIELRFARDNSRIAIVRKRTWP